MHQESNFDTINFDALIEQYKPLVIKIVNRMNYGYVDRDDLIQAGLLGLYDALKKYDQTKSESFISYASIYIISAIKEELRNNKLIVLNKEIISIIRKIRLMDSFSLETVSQELNVSKEKIILAYIYKDKVLSLDDSDNGTDDIEEQKNAEKERNAVIHECIKKLSEDEQKIIYGKYFYEMNQQDLAKMMKISQSTISRKEKVILDKLRKLLKEYHNLTLD